MWKITRSLQVQRQRKLRPSWGACCADITYVRLPAGFPRVTSLDSRAWNHSSGMKPTFFVEVMEAFLLVTQFLEVCEKFSFLFAVHVVPRLFPTFEVMDFFV